MSQDLLARFNATGTADEAERTDLLGALLGQMGESVVIKPVLRCDYGYNISIGARTFINYDCTFLDCSTIAIGEEVQIAPNVQIYTATHPLDAATRRSGVEYALPVRIGDGAWIGGGAIVCPGVSIGENSVIGAGSVVTKDIPPNVLAAGNPARVIRQL
ncbi:sugar O-acetyltransferase [Poseidonocella sp. HB161398]|uniref:sugar O-acetyltransferase n=1 Tax=Poseidonocella sp. HB161398 TaxID=2320855 RepID=UPI00110903D5|nr:sugar O-acetyltransferase [Poseidonocella sp. HB161398]